MLIAILLISLFVFIAIGLPIAIALAGSSLLYIVIGYLTGEVAVPSVVVIHRMVNGVDSFPLLAVPFFIFAGNLMNTSGITKRIYDFALAVVGWAKGGLGHVNVVGSVIFAGMSGTAVADAGGLGTIEIKAMRDHGYDVKFAVGLTAASSTIGPIIPPSLPMVIYGVVGGVSIGQLFVAGVVPGLLMAAILMGMVYIYAHRRGWKPDMPFSLCGLWVAFKLAWMPLMTPVIILGGMVFGVFTPTEAAVAACVWALFLGLVVYRTVSWRQLVRVSMDTIETTAVVLLVVAGASIFGWILATTRVTEAFAEALLDITRDPVAILILINVLLLIVGCFLETIAAITILTPVLLPVAVQVGVDLVQFGLIMVLNLMIGLLTPPVGMVLYVLTRVANISFEECVRACAPFIIPLLLVLGLITFVPFVTLWLPTLIFR
ncbi:MAG: TRAP transporter large permease [Pseudorhodoplanes sp.]|nr:TRAP transporter large permease [Pseudorhodoplanes sp.]